MLLFKLNFRNYIPAKVAVQMIIQSGNVITDKNELTALMCDANTSLFFAWNAKAKITVAGGVPAYITIDKPIPFSLIAWLLNNNHIISNITKGIKRSLRKVKNQTCLSFKANLIGDDDIAIPFESKSNGVVIADKELMIP